MDAFPPAAHSALRRIGRCERHDVNDGVGALFSGEGLDLCVIKMCNK